MIKLKRQVGYYLLSSLVLFPFNVYAQKLLIGAFESLPPYSYVENGEPVGIDIEITSEIFNRLGLDVEYALYPWTRLMKGVEDGHLAGIAARFCSGYNTQLFNQVDTPTYVSNVSIFTPKNKILLVSDVHGMKNKLVGIIRGYRYGDRDFDEGGSVMKVSFDSNEELVNVTANERVDLSIAESIPFAYFSARLGLQDKISEVHVLVKNNMCLNFSKKYIGLDSDVMVGKADAIIQQLKKEGFIDKVLNKYKVFHPAAVNQ